VRVGWTQELARSVRVKLVTEFRLNIWQKNCAYGLEGNLLYIGIFVLGPAGTHFLDSLLERELLLWCSEREVMMPHTKCCNT
jgi:hypothetical protein